MIQFYDPNIEEFHRLCAEESAHAVRVLRKMAGDTIFVTDGRGARMECRLLSADQRGCEVDIVNKVEVAPYWDGVLTLAVAPTKHMDRMEWLVEKAVEIGVDRIVLIRCSRSERKVVKPERLRKIAISAMKQSLKTHLPLVTEIMPIQEFLKECTATQKFMGYCSDTVMRRRLVDEYQPGADVTVLIGPEGDFSSEEVARCISAGFVPVTFGEARLRTETAALSALQTIHVLDQLHHKL